MISAFQDIGTDYVFCRLDHKWNYECATCREKFPDKNALDAHQATLEHSGVLVHEDTTENGQGMYMASLVVH